jgi:Flp pilus assembly protein TadG
MVRRAHTARREDGQATVEFAIVIPLLLLLVVGIFEFGKAFNYWIDLNHLSNEGARWAAVDRLPGNPSPKCPDFKTFLRNQMNTGDLQSKVLPSDIVVQVTGSGPGGAPQIDPVSVSIKAPGYKIASLGENINLGTVTLGSKSTMRLEQVPSWTTSSDPC